MKGLVSKSTGKLIGSGVQSQAVSGAIKPDSLEDTIDQNLSNAYMIHARVQNMLNRLRNQGSDAGEKAEREPQTLHEKLHKTRELLVQVDIMLDQIFSDIFRV